MTLNEYAIKCHEANKKWWQNIDTGEPLQRNPHELIMLMVSELSECMEGERKNLMDDKLPHRRMAEVEIVDFLIRAFDFAAGFGIPLEMDYVSTNLNGFRDHLFSKDHAEHWGFGGVNRAEKLLIIVSDMSELSLAIYDDDGESQIAFLMDGIKRAFRYAGGCGYDLDGAFVDKQAYNATRVDHTHEARRIAGGKQF